MEVRPEAIFGQLCDPLKLAHNCLHRYHIHPKQRGRFIEGSKVRFTACSRDLYLATERIMSHVDFPTPQVV